MIKRSKEEVKAKIEEMWPEANITVTSHGGTHRITLSAMYRPPGLSFKQLMELSEWFGTLNINTEDYLYSRGCDTCDYGSSAEYTLVVLP